MSCTCQRLEVDTTDLMQAEIDNLRAALRDMTAERDQWCLQTSWALRAQIKAEAALATLTAQAELERVQRIKDRDAYWAAQVRVCAACELASAAPGDRYCAGCANERSASEVTR